MGMSRLDASRLLNGQFREVSVERLMRLLTRLGCDVHITIRNHGKAAARKDTIRLPGASSQGHRLGRLARGDAWPRRFSNASRALIR